MQHQHCVFSRNYTIVQCATKSFVKFVQAKHLNCLGFQTEPLCVLFHSHILLLETGTEPGEAGGALPGVMAHLESHTCCVRVQIKTINWRLIWDQKQGSEHIIKAAARRPFYVTSPSLPPRPTHGHHVTPRLTNQ